MSNNGVFTRSSKLPATIFKIHVLMLDVCWKFARSLLEVCWTFAGLCKHHISDHVKFRRHPNLTIVIRYNAKSYECCLRWIIGLSLSKQVQVLAGVQPPNFSFFWVTRDPIWHSGSLNLTRFPVKCHLNSSNGLSKIVTDDRRTTLRKTCSNKRIRLRLTDFDKKCNRQQY